MLVYFKNLDEIYTFLRKQILSKYNKELEKITRIMGKD